MNYINIFVLILALANAAQIPSDFESDPYSALKSRIKSWPWSRYDHLWLFIRNTHLFTVNTLEKLKKIWNENLAIF